ncbi:MAG: phosphotransferase [Spirochaetia bacterium]|nr:phosphotransferase [Spirochaetia bacterium]
MTLAEEEIRSVLGSEGFADIARVIPLQGDLSKRTYFRIEFSNPWQSHPSLILCVHPDPRDPALSDFKAMALMLAQNGLRVSNVVHEIISRGWLLETDVGAEDLQTFVSRQLALHNDSGIQDAYGQVLGMMVAFHAIPPGAPAAERQFDTEKLEWELNYLMESLERFSVRAGFKYFLSFELKMFFKSLCERLDQAEPKVMVHRDLHSKNVFQKDGQWALIDFQDARMGLPWYDLVSLVYDPYVRIPRTLREDLIKKFLSLSGRRFSENLFYMQALQRTLKAIGTYCAVLALRSDAEYFRALKQAIEYLEEIIQLGGFPDHTFLFCNSLRKALGDREL